MRTYGQRALAAIDGGRPVSAAPTIVLPPGFRSSLLEGLTPSEIKAVLAAARMRRILPRQVLQQEGDPATDLRLLVTGRAAFYKHTSDGRKLFLQWIVPGDTFGLSTLERIPYLTTVQAVRAGSVLAWDRDSARALFSRYPQLDKNFNSALVDYLAICMDLLLERASQNAQQRLARMLIESARQLGRAGADGIELDLTNGRLAEMADVSLFTASRQLSEWHSQGILAKSRGKILVRSPERLVSQHFRPITTDSANESIATGSEIARLAMRAPVQTPLAAINGGRPVGAAPTAPLPPGFRSKLLEGLTPSEIKAVIAAARPGRISPRQIIRNEGDPVTHLFLVVTGHAVHYTMTDAGEKLFLRWFAPGDVFGIQALQREPAHHNTTIEAVQKGSVLMWERASARALRLQYPQIFENAYSSVLNRVTNVIDKLVLRAGRTAQQRLARMLVESAHQIGRARRDGIEFDVTNEQLADLAGVSLFTASHQLSEWQNQGVLIKRRGKILLRSPQRLVSQHF